MKKNVEGKSFMDKKDLVKYLSYLKAMEESIYTLEATKSKLTQRINSLGFPYKYYTPVKKSESIISGDTVGRVVFAGIIGLIIGVIAGFFNFIDFKRFFIDIAAFAIPIPIIVLILSILKTVSDNRNYDREYQSELKNYELNTLYDKQRVEQELKEKNFLIGERTKIENQLSRVKYDLSEAYSIGVIFETYRNFCAVSSFYEYLASGVCDSLDGPDGAMRLYRNEVLQGRIIESLQRVISSLEDIKQNQYTLYEAIERGNVTSENLLKSSIQLGNQNEQIIRNTAIDAHNSEIAKNDLNMLTWITAANSKW